MLQQDRLQAEMKALINDGVSSAKFIPETLLRLLGKESPSKEGSRFLKSQEVKPFIQMELASGQDPSKGHLCMLWALAYLWIVCTNIAHPHVLCTEKENLGGSCFYDFWSFLRDSKAQANFAGESHSPFSGFQVQVSG